MTTIERLPCEQCTQHVILPRQPSQREGRGPAGASAEEWWARCQRCGTTYRGFGPSSGDGWEPARPEGLLVSRSWKVSSPGKDGEEWLHEVLTPIDQHEVRFEWSGSAYSSARNQGHQRTLDLIEDRGVQAAMEAAHHYSGYKRLKLACLAAEAGPPQVSVKDEDGELLGHWPLGIQMLG